MNNIQILSGTVSHSRTVSTTSGSIDKGKGTISTSHTMSFRLDNTPVVFSGTPSLGDGDRATVAGLALGEFRAYALRNDSTGLIYRAHTTGWFVGLVIFVLLCIPGISSINSIGGIVWTLVTGGPGCLCYFRWKTMREANRLLA